MIDLKGKVVLVTGASRGIGATTARTLSQAGADVVLHYGSSRNEAEAVAEQIRPNRCQLVSADLSLPDAATELWQQAINWQGRVDVLVNNAAVMPSAAVEDEWEIWSGAWQTTLQVNLVSVANLCRAAIQHFRSQQGGIIINVASRAAFRGDGPEYMHYAASKGGVIALTRSIARGFAKDNILAFAIAPGFVHTERIEQVMQERGADYVTRDIPMGKPAPTQDVANVIAFLASGLAPHATGTTIDINGASYVR
ncbi:SDR family NAD(P)-dependent oxidoreductase [Leptolyngbya sp. FACHB-261]|uniref:SDR family NAD(P)-dependent oxidoreductase n=1 Tax=Leptolyngbya sp. FACHB-261 TaxID=2692806 RepID=UPI0016835DEA|nr:SDR family oxidoreductase [Leptolyngbya sp. FACHB-261]MBD2104002.1 SDR family oxidoreductase [Leptolyngbya sp. FACHB-261]